VEVNAQIKALQQRQRPDSARRQPLQEDAALALNAAPAEVRAVEPGDVVGLPSSRSTRL